MFSFTSSSKRRGKLKSTPSITTTTNPKKARYDVYLSFCDEDKDVHSFVLSIYNALSRKAGVDVFWENERNGYRDREKPTSVLNVIRDCKVVVILFSRDYFNSRSCLHEFKKITECCRKKDDLMVLPVFYDGVDLSFGSWERGMFGGETFHDCVDRILMKKTSKEEDEFMTWVASISKATIYTGLSDLEDR
jgi:hypothetical protein